MSTTESQARRQFAQNKLAEMATLNEAGRLTVLRHIMASVLEFTPVNSTTFTIDNPLLPKTATVIAELANEFGPDYTAVHFDLSEQSGTDPRHPEELLAQVQAANSMVQQYAGEERYPLLIFTRSRSVQFITGDPVPENHHRIQDVWGSIFYWSDARNDAPGCLSQVGDAIAKGEVPQRAFQNGFKMYVPAQCRHCGTPLTYLDDFWTIASALTITNEKGKPLTRPYAQQNSLAGKVRKSANQSTHRRRPKISSAVLFPKFDRVWNENAQPSIKDFAEAYAELRGAPSDPGNLERRVAEWCGTREEVRKDQTKSGAERIAAPGRKTKRYQQIRHNKSWRR